MKEQNIKLVRIDDRLIHGQVATTWTKVYNIEQIIIIDDEAKSDPMIQSVADFAVPPGVKVAIFGVNQFKNVIKNNHIKRSTMLLFTNVLDVLEIVNAGLNIDVLNAGGMRFKEGRKRISRAVSVTEKENEAFKELQDKGIELLIQMIPTDEKEKYIDVYND